MNIVNCSINKDYLYYVAYFFKYMSSDVSHPIINEIKLSSDQKAFTEMSTLNYRFSSFPHLPKTCLLWTTVSHQGYITSHPS